MKIRVGDDKAGKRGKCPGCKNVVTIPAAAEPPVEEENLLVSAIWGHDKPKDFTPVPGEYGGHDEIVAHVEQHIGPVNRVFHEIVSHLVHIDLLHVAPTAQRPYHTIVTSGMSAKPMPVPAGAEDCRYAEVMLCLPESWPLPQDSPAGEQEEWYWPLRGLKFLARMPHEYDTWLWAGHTVPNGDPPQPFASNTKMCCAILLPSITTSDGFDDLVIDAEKTVAFWAVWPIYAEEMEYALKHGAEKLTMLFAEESTELLDINRPNACKKRGWFS